MKPQNAASHLGLFCLLRENLSKKVNKKSKITPDVPKTESGLTQMITMRKSIRQIWVNMFSDEVWDVLTATEIVPTYKDSIFLTVDDAIAAANMPTPAPDELESDKVCILPIYLSYKLCLLPIVC